MFDFKHVLTSEPEQLFLGLFEAMQNLRDVDALR